MGCLQGVTSYNAQLKCGLDKPKIKEVLTYRILKKNNNVIDNNDNDHDHDQDP